MHVAFYAGGGLGGIAAAVAEVEGLVPVLEAADDAAGLARVWRLLFGLYGTSGHYDQAGQAAQRVIDFATRASDVRLVGSGIVNYSICALHGPTSVTEALARCEELVIQVHDDRKAEAVVLSVLAVLYAMDGQLDRARMLAARSQENMIELGSSMTGASTSVESTRVEMLAANPVAAAADLRRDHDALAAMGETYFRSSIGGLLGHAYWALGDFEEAERFAAVGEDLADADDVDSQVIWRSVRSKLLARDGKTDDAVALAENAVELARGTDDIEQQADALRDLAEVLAITGAQSEGPPLREALELYVRKGDVIQAERIRGRLVDASVA